MITKRDGAARQDLKTLFTLGTVGGLTDGELLGLFIAQRGEAAEQAFSVLVERHGPMVERVCRSVLRNEHDTGDAFQATFLVLVERASSVRNQNSLASWLHGVALRIASSARGSVARRRVHERRAADLAPTDFSASGVEPDLALTIHQELGRLPEHYRQPVVLCYLEGLPCDEAARRLGCPVGTVKSRLARGRERLQSRLVRRGLAPTAAVIESSLFGKTTSAAMPAGLVVSTLRLAIKSAGGGSLAGVVPVAIALLTEGALKAMEWSRWKGIAQWILVTAIVMAGAGGVAQVATSRGGGPPPAKAPQVPDAFVPRADVKAQAAEAERTERLLTRCRDLIEKLDAGHEKARLLSELATTRAELGYYNAAREIGHRATEVAASLEEGQSRVTALREAAGALGRAGDLDGALAAEEKIGVASPYARDHRKWVLQEVGGALAKGGFMDETKQVMSIMRRKGLKEPTDTVAFFLATAQAKAGDVKAAIETADSISGEWFRVGALVGFGMDTSTYYGEHEGGIALVRFQSGDRAGVDETLRKAQAIAEKVVDGKLKGQCLSLIARAKLKMGDLSGAARMAAEIVDDTGRDRLQVEIATAHADAGRWDEAMKVIESIRGDAPRFGALCHVGRARGRAKEPEAAKKLFSRALEIAKDLKLDGQPDPTGPSSVALAQAETGDYRAAKETLRLHSVYPPGAEEIAEVIPMTQARAGEFTKALFTLESLPRLSDSTRSTLLSEIVRLQIESSKDEQVLDWVETLDSPVCEARVLMGIARGLAARKRAARAQVDPNPVR